jgi:hypothetical protein
MFDLVHSFVTASLQGELTNGEVEDFEQLLRDNAEARQAYARYLETTLLIPRMLATLAAEAGQSGADRPSSPADSNGGSAGSPPAVKSPVLGFLGDLGDVGRQGWGFVSGHATFFSLLAAVVLVAAGIAVWSSSSGRRNRDGGSELADRQSEISNPDSSLPAPRSPLPAAAPVARLTRTVDSRWDRAAPPPELGTAFAAGEKISLGSGVVELEFDVGVRAVVQGPAKLDLVAADKVYLRAGKISAEILKPEARGFEVQTPKGSIVDLGTEFGVDVTPSEDVQVHVFKGEVVVQQAAEQLRAGQQGAEPAKPVVGQHLLVDQGLRMEGGRLMPSLVTDLGETFIRTIDDAQRDRHVVAYWRFEDQPLGSLAPDTSQNTKPVRATVDSSFNGNDLYTFFEADRPTFSADVPAGVIPQTGSPNRSCLDTRSEGLRNVYTHSEFSHAAPFDIQKIAPAQWTIEASVNSAKRLGEVQTIVGRDTHFSLKGHPDPPRLAFEINADKRFAIAYFDAANRRHEAIGKEPVVEANRWYHVAAASDGRTLRLYVDALDGHGYLLRASTELPGEGSTALGKGDDDAEWTIGRGWKDSHAHNRFQGLIDEVRVSDVALSPSEFLFAPKSHSHEAGAAMR